MSDLITDEMVETTAEAQWRYDWPLREFHREPDDIQDYYRTSARVALETVAPLIAAKALRDAADEYIPGLVDRGYMKRYLTARAERIKRGES